MMHYSNVYEVVIRKRKMKEYIKKHGEDIHHNGTHELVGYYIGEDCYWINMDVLDDYKTPCFHVRINDDGDLNLFNTFEEAMVYYSDRIIEAQYTLKKTS